MKVGYCVQPMPQLASFRLRVGLPAMHVGCAYKIGPADVNFFYKNGNPAWAADLPAVVFDVVNDHFRTQPTYREMCDIATTITVASPVMADTVREHTGRDAIVIDDPYENDEKPVRCSGDNVLWFGHSANLSSLPDLSDLNFTVCSNTARGVWWTPDSERQCLTNAAVVVLTGNNPGASSNRVVKALRAGRPVVVPRGTPSWEQFEPYIWLGDVRKGVEWVLNNREEACNRTLAGQKFIADKWHPRAIAAQWKAAFSSTLAAAT